MKVLGIYCEDCLYTERLAEYLSDKVSKEFRVVAYKDEEEITGDVKKGSIDSLIIDGKSYRKIKENNGRIETIENKICLTEERDDTISGCISLYMYAPASALLPKLLKYCETYENEECIEDRTVISAVYSPIGGIGTTSFTICYIKEKAKKGNILYINTEAYSAISEMLFLDDKYTVTDAMYAYITEENNGYDIKKYIQTVEGFDVMAPSRSYVELNSIDIDKWKSFICYLKKNGEYNEIVLELSPGIGLFTELIKLSDNVMILKREGLINRWKTEAFTREIRKDLTDEVHDEKVKYITLPFFEDQEDEYEAIETTDIGKWAGKIIEQV